MLEKTARPRITFGIIVLNGEPFTRYCLRSIYPFAHEIIVVEGACRAAASIATADGHSTDDTLEVLRNFKADEDKQNKVKIITRDGFWTEKDEQSRAYAAQATGDYLWQVDIDEFYQPQDMERIINMLESDREIAAVSFKQITFWGSPEYKVDSWYLRGGADIYHRLFKWGPGYEYATHRPPTIHDERGRDLRRLKWVGGKTLARKDIYLYHYSLLFPKQVMEKAAYYANMGLGRQCRTMPDWAEHDYLALRRPYRVHNVHTSPSWLERFPGGHPPAVLAMLEDGRGGLTKLELRSNDDVERLLNSPGYRLGSFILKGLVPVYSFTKWLRTPVRLAKAASRKVGFFEYCSDKYRGYRRRR